MKGFGERLIGSGRELLNDWREMAQELIEYRELLAQMTMRDLRLRYKQTIMGFGWAVFMPIVNTVVFSVIFTRVAKIETPVPYPLFAYLGFLAWNFFASSLRFSVVSLTSNAVLVTKVYFPREIFPVSTVIVCAVDCAVGAIVLLGLMAYYDVGVGINILWLPAIVMVHVCFALGISLFLAMANLFFRDVKYLLDIAVTVWMFATPVIYPVDQIGGNLGRLLSLNPLTPVIEAYRNVVLLGTPPPINLVGAAIVSVGVLALAWSLFHRAEFKFAETI